MSATTARSRANGDTAEADEEGFGERNMLQVGNMD